MSVFAADLFVGKTVVVTGSSTGIGRNIALAFASVGANVVIHGRGASNNLAAVGQQLSSIGSSFKKVFGDFSSEDFHPEEFVADAWQQFGGVDVWVNNAGGDVLTGGMSEKTFAEKLQYLMQVDVTATLALSRTVGAKMATSESTNRQQFSIVNIGWDQAWIGMEGDAGDMFATTKGAIMSATKSLAHSLAPKVRVNCVAPGWIKTSWGESTSEYWDQRARKQALLKRWGTPADVANAVVFLASPAASFITGQIVNVNGGFNSYAETS